MKIQYVSPAAEVLTFDCESSILALSDGRPIEQPDSFDWY